MQGGSFRGTQHLRSVGPCAARLRQVRQRFTLNAPPNAVLGLRFGPAQSGLARCKNLFTCGDYNLFILHEPAGR